MARSTRNGQEQAGQRGWSNILRRFLLGLLIVVGSLAFGVYVVVHWVERQILTTDNWVALVSPLPKQPAVSTALGSYISNQVFSASAVESRITDALPPRASFLAGPLTSQLQGLTTKTAQRIVAGDAFQTLWTGANRAAMNRLVTTARGQTPPVQGRLEDKFNINLSGATGQLGGALGSASNAIPALQPATQKAIAISTDLRTQANKVRQYIRTVDFLAAVLPMAVAASLLWAFAWSHHRRHTGLAVAITVLVLMLLELIAIKLLRQQTLDQVRNASNLTAVGYVYDTLVGLLKHMIYAAMIVMLILIGLLLAAGPAEWAKRLREAIHVDWLKRTRARQWWRGARVWLRAHEYYIWLAVAVIVLAIVALFLKVNSRIVTNAVLLILGLFALIHIIATPPYATQEE